MMKNFITLDESAEKTKQRWIDTFNEEFVRARRVYRQHQIARCNKELDRLEIELRAGKEPVEGILLGIADWSREKRLLEDGD